MGRWEQLNYLPKIRFSSGKHKIALVCGSLSGTQTLSLQDVTDQISMLIDLRTVIAQINQDIVAILHQMKETGT
jgi:hypothetical protein